MNTEKEKPQIKLPTNAVSIDLGSTQTKIGSTLDNRGEKKRLDFKPNTETLKYSSNQDQDKQQEKKTQEFRIIRRETIDQLIQKIRNSVRIFYEDTEADKTFKFITLTGFTNSLALVYEKGKDEKDYVVLLDEPSLTPDLLTDEQKKLLERYGISSDKKISSLQKLIAIINNPKLLKTIFGKDVTIDQIKISTMAGLISWHLNGQNPQRLTIPYADLVGFGKKDISPDEAEEILKELGLKEDQFKIGRSYFEDTLEGQLYIINDFESELEYISSLRKNGNIGKDDIVIGFDSVGKIVFSKRFKNQTSKFKKIPERYTTQRMTGNIITDWFRKLGFVDKEGNNNYFEINKILQDLIAQFQNQSFQSDFFYFPDQGEKGKIIRIKPDGSIEEIDENTLEKLNDEEKKQVFFAIAIGMVFGIRNKIEKILKANNFTETPNLFIYGGLPENQPGWQAVIKSCLSQIGNISLLNIPNANITTQNRLMKIMEKIQETGENKIIIFLKEKLNEIKIFFENKLRKIKKPNKDQQPINELPTINLEDYWNNWNQILTMN
ncbi:MAG: hypothetical protein N2593_03655 [Patescibacteria group bacterium]|nr:hypothetical protein [Patescibacteria group bacterium]